MISVDCNEYKSFNRIWYLISKRSMPLVLDEKGNTLFTPTTESFNVRYFASIFPSSKVIRFEDTFYVLPLTVSPTVNVPVVPVVLNLFDAVELNMLLVAPLVAPVIVSPTVKAAALTPDIVIND